MAILLITPVYLILCCGYRYATGADLTWAGRDFCAWIIFYYTGMLIRRYGWTEKRTGVLVNACVPALLISIAVGCIVNFKLGMFSMAVGQINIATMGYSLTVIALIMNYRVHRQRLSPQEYVGTESVPDSFKGIIMRVVVYIGDISFGIYFCHTFVLRCVSFVLRRAGFMEAAPLPLIQLVQLSFTLIGCIIGIHIIWRLDKNRKLCPYLGF